jgi:hypothetical protein
MISELPEYSRRTASTWDIRYRFEDQFDSQHYDNIIIDPTPWGSPGIQRPIFEYLMENVNG